MAAGLLWLLPVTLLLAAFALGHYPSERVLLMGRRPARVRRAPTTPRTLGNAGRSPHTLSPAGTALLAFKRAVRPPPTALAAGR